MLTVCTLSSILLSGALDCIIYIILSLQRYTVIIQLIVLMPMFHFHMPEWV